MSDVFDQVSTVFRNASVQERSVHRIDSYPPVDQFHTECRQWFRLMLEEQEEPHAAGLRMRLARLKGTVLFSLVTFDDPALDLRRQFAELAECAQYYPALASRIDTLEMLVRFLEENPHNPKAEFTSSFLMELSSQALPAPVGIVSPRSRLALPGWGDQLLSVFPYGKLRCEIITSRKALLARNFSVVLLPWSGKGCPFLYEIFHAYRSPRIQSLVYRYERPAVPMRRNLPGEAATSVTTVVARMSSEDHEFVEDPGDPDWKSAEFWEALRGTTLVPGLPPSKGDNVFVVQARLIMLASDFKVFLKEGSRIIEISDILEGLSPLPGTGARFPRVLVGDLEPGDLIVLRTSGSGDYLIDAANALMRADGQADLRERALDWKVALGEALETHGSALIAELLAQKGHGLKSPHSYIWNWTTNDVIRPQSESQFYELLAILQDLGFLRREALETAESRWVLMREIVRYHYRAGNQIRQALLRQLRKMVARRIHVTENMTLTLTGVEAGELSVLRVTAVDPLSSSVPYHRLGTLLPLYE